VTLAVLIGFPLLFGSIIFLLQRRMLYFPQSYDPVLQKMVIGKSVAPVAYDTSAGRQVAFYIAPQLKPDLSPERLWVFFAGNASQALDWLDLVERRPDPGAGYLLIDYPGYGQCEGKPSLESIRESSEGAFAALAKRFALAPAVLDRDLNVIGHSIGAATALQFAARHPVRRVVLISPFTSLYDTVRYHVGCPLCWLLLDRFDNRARLAELPQHAPRPAVTIIHGDADNIVPVQMGRELAGRYPDWIAYHELKGGDHGFIITSAEEQILAAMRPK
jgi:predicted esterase